MKEAITVIAVIIVMFVLGVMLLTETVNHKEKCEARGGVWLAEDGVCIKGERIDLTEQERQ